MVIGKNYFNHCSIGWNCFQRLQIDVQLKPKKASGAKCEFDQNEDTFSVYFDELEPSSKMIRKNMLEG